MIKMNKQGIRTATQAIRAHCLECGGGSYKEVRDCTVLDCPIYLYRLGKRPKIEDIKDWEKKLEERMNE